MVSIATLVFKPGALSIHRNGTGCFVFDTVHVDVEQVSGGAGVAVIDIPASELPGIRDFLIKYLPAPADQRVAQADRRGPEALLVDRVGARMGHDRRFQVGTIADRDNYRTIAATLGAYALNVAHGAVLADFELAHCVALAARVGCKVKDEQRAFGDTRLVLGEIMSERKRQVALGYTATHDDANPMKMHDEVMTRVAPLPTIPNMRVGLIEAAAIIVVEIERLDRQPCV